jgi:trans-aconitate methyltransferase
MSEKELQWDAELYQGSSAPQYKLGLMTIERLKPKEQEKILEIGPGNAMLTIEIARRIPNGTITAIEISRDMVERAKSNIQKFGIENIKLINIDSIDINYENKFDAVFSNSAIHWVKNLELMYKLLYKSLKPNGRITIQTGLKVEGEYGQFFKIFLKLVRVKEFREYFKEITVPWRFITEQDNYTILKDSGFRNIDIEPYDYSYRFDNEQDLMNYNKAAGLVPFLSHVPEKLKTEVIERFKEIWFKVNKENPLEVRTTRAFIRAVK